MKNQVTDKRHAESASATAICSADADKDNAERKTSKLVKHEIGNIHVEQELPNNGYFKLTISSLEIEFEQE